MLRSFWTSNYRNIRMAEPVKWQKGISFILGACSAGKTNLCAALSDIVTESWNYQEKQQADFRYEFVEEENEIRMQYHRRADGLVDNIELHLPAYHIHYRTYTLLHKPVDIWREFCKAEVSSAIKVGVYQWCCMQEADFCVMIPEKPRNEMFWNHSRIEASENKNLIWKDVPNKITIIDDGEIYGETQLADFLLQVKHYAAQAIVVVRRSQWFEQQYGTETNYYLMKEGEIKPISDYISKDIKSVKGLKNLFWKGVFGI